MAVIQSSPARCRFSRMRAEEAYERGARWREGRCSETRSARLLYIDRWDCDYRGPDTKQEAEKPRGRQLAGVRQES
jgi:hypothetical protein